MLIKKTIQNLPAQLLAPLAQFLSIVAWTHLANQETIGLVTLITSSQELFNAVVLLWWTQFFMRHYHEYKNSNNSDLFFGTSRLLVALIASVQVVLAVINLRIIYPTADINLFLVVSGFVFFRCINQYLCVVAVTEGSALRNSVHTLSGPFFGLLIGLFLLKINYPSPIWPLLGYLIGEFLGVVFFVLFPGKKLYLKFCFDKKIVISAVKYGGPLPIQGLLSWASTNISRYLVTWQLGLSMAGNFAVGYGLGIRAGSMAAMVVTVVALPLAIKIHHQKGELEGIRQLSHNSVLLLGVMVPSLVGLAVLNNYIIDFMLAEDYKNSTKDILVWSLVAGGAISYVSHFLNHIFFLKKKTIWLPVIEFVVLVCTVVLSFFLIEKIGLAGAVIGVVIPKFFQIIVLLPILTVTLGLLVPWSDYARIFTAATLMAVFVHYTDWYFNLGFVISVIVGVFIYLIAMYFLFINRFLKNAN